MSQFHEPRGPMVASADAEAEATPDLDALAPNISLHVEAQRLGRRRWLTGRFTSLGLERAYRQHQSMLWAARLPWWVTTAALLFTMGGASVLFGEIAQGGGGNLRPHVSLQAPFFGFMAFLWMLALYLLNARRTLLLKISRFTSRRELMTKVTGSSRSSS